LWAENNPDKGTTFYIELHVIMPEGVAEPIEEVREDAPSEQLRILLVDDESNVREFVVRDQSSQGNEMDQAGDGNDGWDMI
jgi:hypothetical protein